MRLASRLCRALAPALLAAAAAAVATPATAQESPFRRLVDADAARLLPVLRIEVERVGLAAEQSKDIMAGVAATFQFSDDVRSGRIDPLEFTKARSPRFVVPPDARYDAQCSRSLSGALAVLTLGVSADSVLRDLERKAQAGQMTDGMAVLQAGAAIDRSPAGRAADAAIRFYLARGFRHARARSLDAMLEHPDPADSLTVYVSATNPYMDRDGCAHLPTGATLVLSIETAWAGVEEQHRVERKVRAEAEDVDARFQRVLAEVGWTVAEYQERLTAAMMAVGDADDLATLDGLGQIPDLAAQVAVRKANAAWWTRHRATLDPLMTALLGAR